MKINKVFGYEMNNIYPQNGTTNTAGTGTPENSNQDCYYATGQENVLSSRICWMCNGLAFECV